MRTLTTDKKNVSVVEESRLAVKLYTEPRIKKEGQKGLPTLNML